jgi:microcystin-dependent protein
MTTLVPTFLGGTGVDSTSDTVEFTNGLTLLQDSAVLGFGADTDITLTHVHNTGIRLADNAKMLFGASNDLSIFHDGTNSKIVNTATTDFIIDAAGDIVLDADGGDIIIKDDGTQIGAISNSSSNLAFTSSVSDKDMTFLGNDGGVTITALALDMSDAGKATFNGNIVIPDAGNIGSASDTDAIAIASNGVVTFSQSVTGTSANFVGTVTSDGLVVDSDGNLLEFSRNGDAVAGALKYVDADTGFHFGTTTDHDWYLIANDSKVMKIDNGGDVSVSSGDLLLAHDAAVLKFGTDSDVTLTHVADTGLRMEDNDKLLFGAGDDLQIFHETVGNTGQIQEHGTGGLYIKSNGSLIGLQTTAGQELANFNTGGAVELYHNNAKKFETYSGGVIVTGALDLNGSLNVSDDVALSHDGAVTTFGADGEISLTHDHDVGLALNGGSTIYRTGAGQYDAGFSVREGVQSDAHFEWGHSNTSGYGCTLGATNGGGTPFIGFFNGPGTNSNTFRTYGIRGNGFYAANGALYIYDISTATADNQSVTNRFTFDTTNGNFTAGGTITDSAGGGTVPVGSVIAYGGGSAPTGWLDATGGATVSRTTYSGLFAIIGTSYGSGDGSTTFNLPSLGDRMVMGKGSNNSTIGASSTGASGSFVVATASGSASLTKSTGTFASSAKDSSTATAVTNVTAGGHTHNVTMPAQVCMYIIKS